MRRIDVYDIKVGDILAKDLYDKDGKFILAKGTLIKSEYINIIKSMNVDSVYIDIELVSYEPGYKEETQEECSEKISEIIDKYSYCGDTKLSEVVEIADRIIKDVLQQEQVIYNICLLRDRDKTTYSHSVSVCALAVMISLHLQINEKKIRDMAVGALLHDIGYSYISKEMKYKEVSTYTENDIKQLKRHVINGYTAVEDESWLQPLSKEIILEHHELCDGSGYPFHYKIERLRKEVLIITLCNEFDRMVNGHFTSQMKIHEVIDYLTSNAGIKYDINIVRAFLSTVAVYPVGVLVKINTGETAKVIKQNVRMPLRPVIRIVRNTDGSCSKKGRLINMVEELAVKIIDSTSEEINA